MSTVPGLHLTAPNRISRRGSMRRESIMNSTPIPGPSPLRSIAQILPLLLSTSLSGPWLHGQSAIPAGGKHHWVGRALDGSTMGVWSRLESDQGETIVKFVISTDAIRAVSNREDPNGTTVASAFTVLSLAPRKPGASGVLGFVQSVGPETQEKSRAHGALPSPLPEGLTRELLDLGTSAQVAKQLKQLMEARTAAESLQGMPPNAPSGSGGIHDPVSRREPLPKDMRDTPTAALPGRDGRASGEEARIISGPSSPKTMPSGPKEGGNQPSGAGSSGSQDSENLQARESEVRRHRNRGSSGSRSERSPRPSSRPSRGEPSDAIEIHLPSEITRTVIRPGREVVVETIRDGGGIIFRRGSGDDPRKNPAEGGSGNGIDPATWSLIRGTGLGAALYAGWAEKRNLDFPSLVRQPPTETPGSGAGREVPLVGRSSVVNPSEGGRRLGSGSRKPIDMKDPVRPGAEGGGNPRTPAQPPTPRPKP